MKTPRGGRHYVLVFDNANSGSVYQELWNRLGLYHNSGKIELYPRAEKGIRLPFGHAPGFDPVAWIHFTLRYVKRKVRRFNIVELLERAEQQLPPRTPIEVLGQGRSGGSLYFLEEPLQFLD